MKKLAPPQEEKLEYFPTLRQMYEEFKEDKAGSWNRFCKWRSWNDYRFEKFEGFEESFSVNLFLFNVWMLEGFEWCEILSFKLESTTDSWYSTHFPSSIIGELFFPYIFFFYFINLNLKFLFIQSKPLTSHSFGPQI